MKLNRLSFLKAMSQMPLVGHSAKLRYYTRLHYEIVIIEDNFNSATVRFKDQMHDLYDCLKGLDFALEEDFQWFRNLDASFKTKTAADAVYCLSSITNGWLIKTEDYFKESEVTGRLPFLSWYSNNEYADQFIGLGVNLLYAYTTRFPRNEETGVELEQANGVYWNKSLSNFCSSLYFRFVVDDLITLVRIALESQIRRLNG